MFKHIHKYQRVPIGSKGNYVFRCMLRSCPHYIIETFVIGKESICWRCESAFMIRKTRNNHVAMKPICEDCRLDRKRKPIGLDLDSILRGVKIG